MSEDLAIGGGTEAAAQTQTTGSPPPAQVQTTGSPAPAQPAQTTTPIGGAIIDAGGVSEGEAASLPKGDDWRASIAGDDQAMLKALSRFGSLADFGKSWKNAQEMIRSGKLKQTALPENATAEEVAEFRKAAGLPETPDAYEFPEPTGGFSDGEKAIVGSLKARLHKANAPPAVVKAVGEWYGDFMREQQQAMETARIETMKATRQELVEEWGGLKEYEKNVQLANAFLTRVAGSAEAATELGQIRLADGSMLGANKNFVKLITSIARNSAGDDLVAMVEAPGSRDLQSRLDELYSLNRTDPARYASQSVQEEILRLETARLNRGRFAA